jgi:hypothetical protein
MQLPGLPELILFMAAVLAVSAFVITAAGQFPREHRKPALDSPAGAALLWLTIALAAVAVVATLLFAWLVLPWYATVLGGGLMILVAPYVLHPLPDRVVNGPSALVGLSALALVLAGGMWWLA